MPRESGKISGLVERVRFPKGSETEADIAEKDKELIVESAQKGREILEKHFEPG